jgi:hypothetical protein
MLVALLSFEERLAHFSRQEDKWAKDANVFVAQEEDEAQDYSVRIASFDLLAVSNQVFLI